MERDDARRVLIFYRDIDGEIALHNRTLRYFEDQYCSISGSAFDGMPKPKNKQSNPTEKLALNTSSLNSLAIRDLQAQHERLCKLKDAVSHEINKLPLLQKNVLFDFYIRGLKWEQISVQVNYSERQCKRIRNFGLDYLAKLFDKNEFIKNFNYLL